MSDVSQGEGWWEASDGKWYPPELAQGAPQAQPTQAAGFPGQPGGPPQGIPAQPGGPGQPGAPGHPANQTVAAPAGSFAPPGGPPPGGPGPQGPGQAPGFGQAPVAPQGFANTGLPPSGPPPGFAPPDAFQSSGSGGGSGRGPGVILGLVGGALLIGIIGIGAFIATRGDDDPGNTQVAGVGEDEATDDNPDDATDDSTGTTAADGSTDTSAPAVDDTTAETTEAATETTPAPAQDVIDGDTVDETDVVESLDELTVDFSSAGPAAGPASCEVTGIQADGDYSVDALITNNDGVRSDYRVDYDLLGPDNARIDSDYGIISGVESGTTVRDFTVGIISDVYDWTEVTCAVTGTSRLDAR